MQLFSIHHPESNRCLMSNGVENLSFCVPRTSVNDKSLTPIAVKSRTTTALEPNHVLICIDRFGFSANNITYQALGEVPHFRYFEFHNVPETTKTSHKSHGLIPVWGFGTVVWSSHKRIDVGERVYGYFAPCRYLLVPVSPSDVNKYSFFVPRPHFPPDRRPYNQITRCRSDLLYDSSPEVEDLTMLYRPLFWTAFWCEDWLAASSFRSGATNFLVSSASSKTAFCLAYLIRKRFSKNSSGSSLNIVGLTSSRNVNFTKGLGLYDRVVDYNSLTSCLTAVEGSKLKWIYVDVAGNDGLNAELRSFFTNSATESLSAHISLGVTNLNPASPPDASSAWSQNTRLLQATSAQSASTNASDSARHLPDPEQFFMPEWLIVRKTQLSVAQITQMQVEAWRDLMRDCRGWVRIERVYGGEAVLEAYAEVVKNGVAPDKGFVWSMWNRGDFESVSKSIALSAKL